MSAKKTAFILVLTLGFLLFFPSPGNAEELTAESERVYLFNLTKNAAVYSKNPEDSFSPGDFTKLVASSVILQHTLLEDELAIPASAAEIDEEFDIAPKAVFSVNELLSLMVCGKSQRAFHSLALHVAGDEDKFLQLMNGLAVDLRLKNTHFATLQGTNEKDKITLSDMRVFYSYFIKDLRMRSLLAPGIHTVPAGEGHGIITVTNDNALLRGEEDFTYTPAPYSSPVTEPVALDGAFAGFVAGREAPPFSATQFYIDGDEYLLLVTQSDSEQTLYADNHRIHRRLASGAFPRILDTEGNFFANFVVRNSMVNEVAGVFAETTQIYAPLGRTIQRKQINLENLRAPIQKGDTVGRIEYYIDGRYFKTVDLVAATNVEALPASYFMYRIFNFPNAILFALFFASYKILKRKPTTRRSEEVVEDGK
jgi:D-alanyl-D-alanine carboxypeptidase (penicillin-binding protein 5/6)